MKPGQIAPFLGRAFTPLLVIAGLALLGASDSALARWLLAAILFALALVGVAALAFTAFFLNLLLGEEPPLTRALLILLFCGGLVFEVCGLAGVFGLLP